MNELVKLMQSKGIPYSFIQIPISNSYYHTIKNKDEFDSLIGSYGPFTNFNSDLNLVDSIHFADHDHLNKLGAQIFSERLIQYLSTDE